VNDDEALDLLEELVRTPSVSGQEADAAELLVTRMTEVGFDASIDPVGNAVGVLGDHGPRLVLLGHVDTVPGEVPVRREEDRLYGRGSVDAKGPLVAFLVAAANVHARGELDCRVELVACVEEEVPSSRGARYRATLPAPDACIIGEPSGWSGVTVGYKGFLRAILSRSQPLAHASGEHSSLAGQACHLFVELEDEVASFNTARDTLFDRLLLHLDDLRIESNGLHERAVLDGRLRLPPDLPPEAALAWLGERAPDWGIEAEGGLPAWSGPRTTPLARLLARSIARCGGKPRYQRKTGTADLNVVAPAWNCPALAYGPGDSSLDHTPDEHLEFDEFFRGIRVLESVLSWYGG